MLSLDVHENTNLWKGSSPTLTVASLLSISGPAFSTAVFWIKQHASSQLSCASWAAACSIMSLCCGEAAYWKPGQSVKAFSLHIAALNMCTAVLNTRTNKGTFLGRCCLCMEYTIINLLFAQLWIKRKQDDSKDFQQGTEQQQVSSFPPSLSLEHKWTHNRC